MTTWIGLTSEQIRKMGYGEPIELRLSRTYKGTRPDAKPYVLWAIRNDHGTITYTLSIGGGGMPNSIDNLQVKGVFPRKTVPGWQMEVVTTVGTGLFPVIEVR